MDKWSLTDSDFSKAEAQAQLDKCDDTELVVLLRAKDVSLAVLLRFWLLRLGVVRIQNT